MPAKKINLKRKRKPTRLFSSFLCAKLEQRKRFGARDKVFWVGGGGVVVGGVPMRGMEMSFGLKISDNFKSYKIIKRELGREPRHFGISMSLNV